jgi:hypothetical protein
MFISTFLLLSHLGQEANTGQNPVYNGFSLKIGNSPASSSGRPITTSLIFGFVNKIASSSWGDT